MAAKMIEELEIAYTSFCASYTVIMDLDTKKSRGGKFVLGNGRSSRPDVFCRKGVLRNFHRKTPVPESLSNKVADNTFFYRTPLVAASGMIAEAERKRSL